ncbi:MAG: tRNA (guanosine(37)-N1)-methyltransferase TrmD [Candidatus Zixiibacteriota bacterium]
MKVTILTIFPEFFSSPLEQSLLQKAIENKTLEVEIVDIRKFSGNKHNTVDDAPFGGGGGMVMKIEPLYDALSSVLYNDESKNRRIVLTSAAGKKYGHPAAVKYSLLDHLIIICGRYKGVDERITKFFDLDEVSIGDYIINGGETAALVILESVFRLLPGSMHDIDSALTDSFIDDILGAPVWTRPAEFLGEKAPATLLEGDHARMSEFRRFAALKRTMDNRPDLLRRADLSNDDRAMIERIAGGHDFDN